MSRDPLLTLPQALAALGCSEGDLDALIRDGKVAVYRIADGRYDLNPPAGPWEYTPPPKPSRRGVGVDWMTLEELSEAIPPAFTEYVGGFLMAEINARQAA